jgi:hypothetical protein
MYTKTTTTFVMVSQEAEGVVLLGMEHHHRFRILPEFRGVITNPVINSGGDWLFIPKQDKDDKIIPKAAFDRRALVRKKGYKVAQEIIGHEIKVAPEAPVAAPIPERGIEWGKVAEEAAKGFLIGLMGIATVSLYALTGAIQLIDPSYCIVLDDGVGTWIELMTWNTEV